MDWPATLTLILTQAAMSATPLLLAGYGELLAERAGVINVGIEGTMLMGAIAAFAGAVLTGSAVAGIPCAIAAGIVFAAIFAIATVWFRADQIVTGTAVNILAFGASTLTFRIVQRHAAGEAPHFDPVPIPGLASIPVIGPAVFSQYALFYLVIPLGIALFLVMRRSRIGLIVRGLGDAPAACEAAGIHVRLSRTILLLLAGAASGCAGAYLSTMRNHSFQLNMTSGQGFLVLALVIFGRWNILGFMAGAFAFAAVDGFQSFFTSTELGQALIAPQFRYLFNMLPYAATLVALALLTRSRSGPIHLGQPWPEIG